MNSLLLCACFLVVKMRGKNNSRKNHEVHSPICLKYIDREIIGISIMFFIIQTRITRKEFKIAFRRSKCSSTQKSFMSLGRRTSRRIA